MEFCIVSNLALATLQFRINFFIVFVQKSDKNSCIFMKALIMSFYNRIVSYLFFTSELENSQSEYRQSSKIPLVKG